MNIAHECCDECAFDKPFARWRVCDRGDNQHLVGIRHDNTFIMFAVTLVAPAPRGSPFELADPRYLIFRAPGISHDTDAVANFDGGPAHFASPHGHNSGAIV